MKKEDLEEVFVYSDFQVSDWQAVQADVNGLGADLILVPVGHENGLWLTRRKSSGRRCRVVPGGTGKVKRYGRWCGTGTQTKLRLACPFLLVVKGGGN